MEHTAYITVTDTPIIGLPRTYLAKLINGQLNKKDVGSTY